MRRPKDHRHGRHVVFARRRMDHRARNLRRRGEELSEDRTLPLVVIEPLLAPTPFRRFRQTPDLIDASSMRPICPYLFTNQHRNMRFEKQ